MKWSDAYHTVDKQTLHFIIAEIHFKKLNIRQT